MQSKYNLTSRQFIIGGITLFVFMLIINLGMPLDGLLRILTILVGAFGLVLAVIFGVSSRSKNEPPSPGEIE